MRIDSENVQTNLILAAVQKFYDLNDDLSAAQAVGRRVFFEFLRTKPTLSTDELDILWSVSELLAALGNAKK